MVRVWIIIAAIIGLTLVIWLLAGDRPEDRSSLPATDTPGVSLTDEEEGTAPNIEASPAPGDVSLEAEEVNVEITREPQRETDPLDVTMPEGERRIGIQEAEQAESPAETPGEADDPETETGDDQPPNR